MPRPLDKYQKSLLRLLWTREDILETLTLREIGEQIGIGYPQGVVNKLKQLENKGHVRKDENGTYRVLKDPVEDVWYFPLIGFAQCGNLAQMTLDDIQATDKIALSTKTLSLSSKEDLTKFFFTKAKGNSMEPEIHEGDLILIKQQSEATESDKALLIHNGSPKIKYLRQKNGQYALFSLNEEVDSYKLSPTVDNVQVVGIVKMVISKK